MYYLGYASAKCTIDLDAVKGKYPPILWRDGDFAYPEKGPKGNRVVTVGRNNQIGHYFLNHV